MSASLVVRLAAASRRKVRYLCRSLSTDQPGNGDPHPAPPPDGEPAERRPRKDPSGRSVLLFPGTGGRAAEDGSLSAGCVCHLASCSGEAEPRKPQGFSVGEFAALVFSGAMNFAEALYAVKVRAEAMQKASELVPSGMLSVIGRPQAQYKYACLQAKEHCKSLGITEPVCSVANYLFPDGRVIAGHQQALDFLQKNSRHLQFMRTKPLPVSGAFHTELMKSATEPLREVLRQVEVRRPEINVYSNVDGKRYMNESHVRRQLVKQLVSPVKWEQTLHEIFERMQGEKFPHTYEVGPGKQLGATLQKCNRKAFNTYTHVDVTTYDD
ncbi:malonyl-CoA-acyl carrier protein transacylase, mitochondrial isoform X2 [Thunnus maccoyii]|uniref:malonyl-CoA-acyl carrier protein transacylase, mitochondrial isoform X2 n=1 Tax=Thunnus maccoyii TaxID=8240 RepID=UPI001C4BF5F7|nr:malonyl-CoA-acyl carrier protein transacylase, mitochondrial isoform X2 [Thunnus maccoyii]